MLKNIVVTEMIYLQDGTVQPQIRHHLYAFVNTKFQRKWRKEMKQERRERKDVVGLTSSQFELLSYQSHIF